MQSFTKTKRNKKINKIGKGKTIIIQSQEVYTDSVHNQGEGLVIHCIYKDRWQEYHEDEYLSSAKEGALKRQTDGQAAWDASE